MSFAVVIHCCCPCYIALAPSSGDSRIWMLAVKLVFGNLYLSSILEYNISSIISRNIQYNWKRYYSSSNLLQTVTLEQKLLEWLERKTIFLYPSRCFVWWTDIKQTKRRKFNLIMYVWEPHKNMRLKEKSQEWKVQPGEYSQ